MSPDSPPTAHDVQRIAAVADPVIRNLQITEFRAYHEDADLATAPFTAAQVASIDSGAIPDGSL